MVCAGPAISASFATGSDAQAERWQISSQKGNQSRASISKPPALGLSRRSSAIYALGGASPVQPSRSNLPALHTTDARPNLGRQLTLASRLITQGERKIQRLQLSLSGQLMMSAITKMKIIIMLAFMCISFGG